MSPTHANKAGVRYRYYTSQALLQGRKADAGSIGRECRRRRSRASRCRRLMQQGSSRDAALDERGNTIEAASIALSLPANSLPSVDAARIGQRARPLPSERCRSAPTSIARKGVMHAPSSQRHRSMARRRPCAAAAIARSTPLDRRDHASQRQTSTSIAEREGVVERHIRLLAPLAFLSPRIIEAIAEGSRAGGLTVTSLARDLPDAVARAGSAPLANPDIAKSALETGSHFAPLKSRLPGLQSKALISL